MDLPSEILLLIFEYNEQDWRNLSLISLQCRDLILRFVISARIAKRVFYYSTIEDRLRDIKSLCQRRDTNYFDDNQVWTYISLKVTKIILTYNPLLVTPQVRKDILLCGRPNIIKYAINNMSKMKAQPFSDDEIRKMTTFPSNLIMYSIYDLYSWMDVESVCKGLQKTSIIIQ